MPPKKGYPKNRPKSANKNPVVRKNDLKKALTKDVEVKMNSIRASDSIEAFLQGPNQFINICPPLDIGVGKRERIGDEVTAKKIVIRGTIGLTYSDLTLNPATQDLPYLTEQEFCQRFRVAIIKSKTFGSDADLRASTAIESHVNLFLDDLNGGRDIENTSGTIRDMFDPINRDWFTVHKEWTRNLTLPAAMARTQAGNNIAGTNTLNGMNSYWNFEYTMVFKGGKKLLFEPQSSHVRNFPYVMALWRKPYSNNALTDKTVSFFDFTSQLFYTDE